MADNNTIKTFTAVDIEKYQKGLLSPKEMHDLEKAALDDPFLADALEGYTVQGVNVGEDIAELKKRLAVRTEKSKVVPLAGSTRSSYLWLRIAAMIVLVAGAGLLVYQFGFNNNRESNVALSPVPLNKEEIKDTVVNNSTNTVKETSKEADQNIPTASVREQTLTSSGTAANQHEERQAEENIFVQKDSLSFGETSAMNNPVASAPAKSGDDAAKKNFTKNDSISTAFGYIDKDGDGVNDKMDKELVARSAQANSKGLLYQSKTNQPLRNIFRGRVTDSSNNPLPFANITNVTDNVGTYADAKGNFVLTSPDSVLNVHVRSVGFTNDNVTLRNYLAYNKVIMKEDYSNMEQVLISNNRNLNSSRSRNSTMVLEEPEPEDGWFNYDTYLANNLNIPETFRSKQPEGGSVEVSFEVDGNGEPINIKIEKSLCESCDKEAVRLVKDGPKFKRKAKKSGRTTVSVPF